MSAAGRIDAVLLDMDGVLYHGERALPDAASFMRRIAFLPHAFITNNPILPPAAVAEKLARLGFERPDPAQIITSAQATALHLAEQQPGFRYFAVGAAWIAPRRWPRWALPISRRQILSWWGRAPGSTMRASPPVSI